MGEDMGYVIAVLEVGGAWTLTWDGELHPTLEAAETAATEAMKSGWRVRLCSVKAEQEGPDDA